MRLIDPKMSIDTIKSYIEVWDCKGCLPYGETQHNVMAVDDLPYLPTIEAEPVRHGRWIPTEYDGYADGNPVYDKFECSECGHEHNGEEDTLTAFCPDCGAKMADLIERDTAYDAIGFERCDRSCTDCPTKCTWFYTIKNIPAVNRWIPCSERLPYIGVDVIVYVRTWREHKVQFGYRYSENTWSVANIGVPNDEITHWMPLPEPPKRGTENGTT